VPGNYTTIQEAINTVANSTIIHVRSGTYYENICLNKSVTLIGENAETTIIDGRNLSNVINVIYATGAEIRGFTLQNSGPFGSLGWSGISTFWSTNLRIYDCIIKNCTYGIEMKNVNETDIGYNILANNSYGLWISTTFSSQVYANIISYNNVGVGSMSETNQITFYRNNFIHNNISQAQDMSNSDKWDNGAEGNFWSDYAGEDTNGDGIGDTGVLPHLGLDFHPLVEPWSLKRSFHLMVGTQTYGVTIFSNTTVASFTFDETTKQLSFNSTAPSLSLGFCSITIPNNLMWGNFTVSTKTQQLTFTKTENATHYILDFHIEFSSTQNIVITSTDAVPEFPSSILVLVPFIAILFALILRKSKTS
jgi:hypothetical protein